MRSVLNQLKKRWKLIVFLCIVVAGALYWYISSSQSQQNNFTFITPATEDLVRTLTISGTVDAKEKARLSFITGGKVTYLGYQQGDFVEKGKTIAVVDRSTLQKQIQQDLNNYMKERWDFEQGKDDTKDKSLTDAQRRTLDQSQWDLENQVLNVEIRNIAIQNTVLSAPFSGILTVSPITVTGVPLIATDFFELVNPDTLVFIGRVDESDIAQVKEGQTTTITLDAYPDADLTTYVSEIAFTSSQTSSGTAFAVEFPLSQVSQKNMLRLGMNGDAEIVLDERKNVTTIPITATKQRDTKIYVDVKTGEATIEEREIQVGLETDDKYEVLGGLSTTDEIVLPE